MRWVATYKPVEIGILPLDCYQRQKGIWNAFMPHFDHALKVAHAFATTLIMYFSLPMYLQQNWSYSYLSLIILSALEFHTLHGKPDIDPIASITCISYWLGYSLKLCMCDLGAVIWHRLQNFMMHGVGWVSWCLTSNGPTPSTPTPNQPLIFLKIE